MITPFLYFTANFYPVFIIIPLFYFHGIDSIALISPSDFKNR
ncbi:hypothetical protein HMPREF0454_01129 [Hafnia alvei ATCC 51873]|uniref:Uncharacterized protein n=1 Tax=Hafnia alvei ATCC 51873 TaxID=1002364 RepID=G9Y3C7_HAFAL|nr:hypothetical protein HMPREF0454_01129 [Hafnia alvei ATCC 51873]